MVPFCLSFPLLGSSPFHTHSYREVLGPLWCFAQGFYLWMWQQQNYTEVGNEQYCCSLRPKLSSTLVQLRLFLSMWSGFFQCVNNVKNWIVSILIWIRMLNMRMLTPFLFHCRCLHSKCIPPCHILMKVFFFFFLNMNFLGFVYCFLFLSWNGSCRYFVIWNHFLFPNIHHWKKRWVLFGIHFVSPFLPKTKHWITLRTDMQLCRSLEQWDVSLKQDFRLNFSGGK